MEEQERQKLIEYCRSRIDASAPFATVRKVLEIALRQLEAEMSQPDGGWIEWPGGECPVSDNVRVEVRFRNGHVATEVACWLDWSLAFEEDDADIVAYHIAE